jgi:hypothetical protein
MNEQPGQKLAVLAHRILIGWSCLFISSLVFRAFVYSRLPIVQGEPYGIADIFEFLFSCALLLSCVAAIALGFVFLLRGSTRRWRLGLLLLIVGAGSFVLHPWLHDMVARIA